MKKTVFFLPLFLAVYTVLGQIKITDSLTTNIITGVNIYSDRGVLLGLSDVNGEINLDSLKNIDVQQVVLQHIGYENKELSYEAFRGSNNILLIPRRIEIDEVSIGDKSQYDYVVLKGYFRTLDLFNDKSRYFYDGIIEYYIPLKAKEKVRRKLLEYRLFANSESLAEYTELFGKALTEPPSLLRVEKTSVIHDLPKNCVLVVEDDKSVVKREGINMGFAQKNKTGNVQVYFDEVPPQSKVSRSFLRIKGEQYRGLTIENYIGISVDKLAAENLVSKVRSSVGAVQRKKKHGYIPMESFEEFYVMERSYLKADEVKKIEKTFTKSIYLEEKSNYKEKFWLNLERYGIPSLTKGIAKQLGNELVEF